MLLLACSEVVFPLHIGINKLCWGRCWLGSQSLLEDGSSAIDYLHFVTQLVRSNTFRLEVFKPLWILNLRFRCLRDLILNFLHYSWWRKFNPLDYWFKSSSRLSPIRSFSENS